MSTDRDTVYDFRLAVDWTLIGALSRIDRFDAAWSALERTESDRLGQLKQMATIRSVGSSTRIEGSAMSDEEVDAFLQDLDVTHLRDRDSEEVAGYYEALESISSSHQDMPLSAATIRQIHKILLGHSTKDEWHRGNYKQHSNSVEAVMGDGRRQIIFDTTPPGHETEDAMRRLLHWYRRDEETHVLVKVAVFTYDFLSIHPFQDGNGRSSRLLSSLLLLHEGYRWIEYMSFEHEIENRKSEYYNALRHCQAQRPGEDVSKWVYFFLDALENVSVALMDKLDRADAKADLNGRQMRILTYIEHHAGCSSGEIAERLTLANPTVKSDLKSLSDQGLIDKRGVGRGTHYVAR